VSLSDWDIDLRDGLAGEKTVASLLQAETIEVKTDRRWYETGNVYVEQRCFYVKDNQWKLSGISVTRATHWAFVLEEIVMIVPTTLLKTAVERIGRPIKCNIPPNYSEGVLINVGELLDYIANDEKQRLLAQAAYESYREPAEPSEEDLAWLNE
jgi:hypothetical protein